MKAQSRRLNGPFAHFPDYPLTDHSLAAALGQLNRIEEAKDALEKAITIAPASFDLYTRQRGPWMRPETTPICSTDCARPAGRDDHDPPPRRHPRRRCAKVRFRRGTSNVTQLRRRTANHPRNEPALAGGSAGHGPCVFDGVASIKRDDRGIRSRASRVQQPSAREGAPMTSILPTGPSVRCGRV